MKRFTDAGRKSIVCGNLYAGLSLALTIPDICASLEDPGPGKSRDRYVKWCENWVQPKFTRQIPAPDGCGKTESKVFVSAQDCYQLRCSLVHSGTTEINPAKKEVLDRFEFFDGTAGGHLNWCERNILNGEMQPNFLQLKADLFSQTLFDAADEWDQAVANDPNVQAEKKKLLVIHTKGDCIGGIRF